MPLVDHIAAVVLVRSERDGWDWFLFGLSVIAALSAVIALWTWWTRLRWVPEVAFGWENLMAQPGLLASTSPSGEAPPLHSESYLTM